MKKMNRTQHSRTDEDARLIYAATAAAIAAAVGAAVAVFTMAGKPDVSLTGSTGLQAVLQPLVILVVVATGLVGYPAAVTRADTNRIERAVLSEHRGILVWAGRLSLALSLGMLTYLALAFGFRYLDYAFAQTTAFGFAAIVATALVSGLVAFAVGYWVVDVTYRDLLKITTLMVNAGLIASMLLVENPRWWTESLSYMGDHAASDLVFNSTMLLAGVNVLVSSAYVVRVVAALADEGVFPRRTPRLLGICLAVIGVGIMFVGLFPWSYSRLYGQLHDIGSHTMLLALLVLMLGLRWIAPSFPRSFIILSTVTGSVIGIGTVLFALQAISFVLFELVVFVMMVPWLLILQRSVTGIANSTATRADDSRPAAI